MAGIKKPATLHSLRHSCAAYLLEGRHGCARDPGATWTCQAHDDGTIQPCRHKDAALVCQPVRAYPRYDLTGGGVPRRGLEVADTFRDHGPAYRRANEGHLSLAQLKVMSAIQACRIEALGGDVAACAK